jgi:hypothetical protein
MERIPPDAASLPLEIRRDERLGQRGLQSLRSFAAGEVIVPFRATATYERPAQMTLQVSEHEHIELTPTVLGFVNHGCAPNVSFDVEQRALVALEPISAGDMLTFFYPSTEWTMALPFDCSCGSPRCLGRVAGASQLPEGALQGHRLAPHIMKLLAQAKRKR